MEDISFLEGTSILEESFISGKKRFKEEVNVYIAEEGAIPEYLQKVTSIEQVANIAKEIFNEEDLHIVKNRIYIRFPELEITNSKEERHTIYDIIVKLTINFREEDKYVTINFEGTRATLTVSEVSTGYRHSHLEGNKFGQFTQFCLGSSNFAILMSNVATNSTATNWKSLFMSIENYLIWESLEGGPHIKMRNVMDYNSTGVDGDSIFEDADKLITIIPIECIDFDRGNLIEGQPLDDFINSNAKIRSSRVRRESREEDIISAQERITELGTKMIWRDGFIPFKIKIEEEKLDDNRKDFIPTVELGVKQIYTDYIKGQLEKFCKNYKHEQYKKTKPRSYFAIGKTKADNIREAPRTDRLPS